MHYTFLICLTSARENNLRTLAPNYDSDQPAHQRSLIRIFVGRSWFVSHGSLKTLITSLMRRLLCVVAVHIYRRKLYSQRNVYKNAYATSRRQSCLTVHLCWSEISLLSYRVLFQTESQIKNVKRQGSNSTIHIPLYIYGMCYVQSQYFIMPVGSINNLCHLAKS